jgi:hypothetical protein
VGVWGDLPGAIEGADTNVADEVARGRGPVVGPQGRGTQTATVDELGVFRLRRRGYADCGRRTLDKGCFDGGTGGNTRRYSLRSGEGGVSRGEELEVLGLDDGVDGKGSPRLTLTGSTVAAMDDEGREGKAVAHVAAGTSAFQGIEVDVGGGKGG